MDRDERIRQLEYELEEAQNEAQRKARTISDHQDTINEQKVDLAGLREQKNSAEREVRGHGSDALFIIKCFRVATRPKIRERSGGWWKSQ